MREGKYYLFVRFREKKKVLSLSSFRYLQNTPYKQWTHPHRQRQDIRFLLWNQIPFLLWTHKGFDRGIFLPRYVTTRILNNLVCCLHWGDEVLCRQPCIRPTQHGDYYIKIVCMVFIDVVLGFKWTGAPLLPRLQWHGWLWVEEKCEAVTVCGLI